MIRHRVQSIPGVSSKKIQAEKQEIRSPCTPDSVTKGYTHRQADYFQEIFGFEKRDLRSWDRFTRLLCRPSDPASLGTLRFFFGLLMMLDIVQERGLAAADSWWGSEEECRFPLFDFLRPLPLQWMYVVYLVMLAGAVGIMLGFKMRLSSALYLATYWYVFCLDKTAWNNHSYLFGILAFLLAVSDANRYWSLDGLLNPRLNNSHIPLWNYTLICGQIFIVYFIAGLKKLDADWISGYSMQSLSHHWVFDPFRVLLTESEIDLYVVHLGGLFIDLSAGFMLFFDKTRLFGLVMTSSFHLMNSQLFSIGMFPWAMLTMQLVFCSMDWPRKYFRAIPPTLRLFTPEDTDFHSSQSCVYPKDSVKSELQCSSLQAPFKERPPPASPARRHKTASVFTITFLFLQLFLPYSHSITKGYNNWTNGLYGYSWDMMIHSWSVQHIHITYLDKDTGQSGHIHPMAWTGGNRRWSSHGDMIKQYGLCIARNLKSYNISNVAVYFDIWRSLNYRFQQRMVDPTVDIITAEWSPFTHPSWIMPLMVDLSDWRGKLDLIQSSLDGESPTGVVFVADFPGMFLENYVHQDFGNTSITVLKGEVTVELQNGRSNVILGSGQLLQVPAQSFHKVHTVSQLPSCYMYTYINTTESSFIRSYIKFEEDYNKSQSLNETLGRYHHDPHLDRYQEILTSRMDKKIEVLQSLWQRFQAFLRLKYNLLRRSIRLSTGAVYCLVSGNSFSEFLNATYQWEATFAGK